MPIDIIPFCKDGELKHKDYSTLKNKVIPEILHAVNLLHASKLIHRDIKPSNIYMLNDEVVVADFGTSGEITSNDELDYQGTKTKRGTVGYTAPEVWQGYAVYASDYYSLGCTIAALYKGEHVYQRLIDDSKNDDTPIKRAINAKGLPLNCPANEADLQSLVDALVMTAETMRAGYEDVKLWLNNPQSFVGGWKHKRQHDDETSALGFNFENKIYNDTAGLTNAMLNQWEEGKRYLYKGIISGFFNQRDPTLSKKAIDIVEGRETARSEDLGLAMFLHYFNTAKSPKCPIYWKGKKYDKISEISISIANGNADENSITEMLKTKFLSWKLCNTQENNDPDTLKAVKEIEDIASEFPQFGYYALMYSFMPDNIESLPNPDEYFKSLTEGGSDWYKKAEELLKTDKIFAYFRNLKYQNSEYKEFVIAIRKQAT
jgi:serine/threonine protein kinase